MNTIKIQRGLFTETLTEKQVRDALNDIEFLCDAILTFGNPELAKKNLDIPHHIEHYVHGVKEILIERGYHDKIFDSYYPQYATP